MLKFWTTYALCRRQIPRKGKFRLRCVGSSKLLKNRLFDAKSIKFSKYYAEINFVIPHRLSGYLNCTNVRSVLLSLGGIRHFFECDNDTEKCQPCYRDKDVVITQAALYSYKIWVISFLFSSFFTFSKISFLVFFESERE